MVSSEDEGHPEKDQDIDEAVEEQQCDQEIDVMIMEQQVDQDVLDVESEASTNSFDSGEEPDDKSNPDYDPSRDR